MIKEKEILRYKDRNFEKIKDFVVEEEFLRVFLNEKEITVLSILPSKIEYLAYGFLFTNNLIESLDEIKKIKISGNKCYVEIENEIFEDFRVLGRNINSGCGSPFVSFNLKKVVENNFKIKSEKLLCIMKKFQNISEIYKKTGGVHSCALSDGDDIIVFAEDISRHNAFDKVVGESLYRNLNFHDKIIFTSGRITSDIVIKGVRIKIPVIISISAPTFYALKIGDFYNITLIGFTRGKRFNIYTHPERVT